MGRPTESSNIMAFDIKKWLVEDLGLSGDALAAVETALAPKADVIGGGFLRQSDYSTKMNELTAAKGNYAAMEQRLNAEMAEWSQLTAAQKAEATAQRTALEATQAEALKLRQKLQAVATDAGLDATKILAEVTTAPATTTKEPPVTQPFDTSKFVGVDQLQAVGAMALSLPAELLAIAEDHKDLFGARMDPRAIITELQARANTKGNQKSLDPRVIWEELHGVPAKRAEVETQRFNTAIAEAEARGAATARSEAALPIGGPAGKHAVVFQHAKSPTGASILQRPGAGPGHDSAVTAFTSGKYRKTA